MRDGVLEGGARGSAGLWMRDGMLGGGGHTPGEGGEVHLMFASFISLL